MHASSTIQIELAFQLLSHMVLGCTIRRLNCLWRGLDRMYTAGILSSGMYAKQMVTWDDSGPCDVFHYSIDLLPCCKWRWNSILF